MAKLLKIFIDSTDKYNGEPLWEYILKAVKQEKLSGATVIKGVAGIGSHLEIHSANIIALSFNLPIIIEIIDQDEKIEKFLHVLEEIIEEGLVITQDVEIKIRKHR